MHGGTTAADRPATTLSGDPWQAPPQPCRTVQAKDTRRNMLKKLAITCCLLVMGSIAGLWIGNALVPDVRTAARHAQWSSLGSPPGQVDAIAGEAPCGTFYGVVVQSSSGATYQYCDAGWTDTGGLPVAIAGMGICQGDPPTQYNPGFGRLPAPVKACAMNFTSEWSVAERVFVILEDNTVWKWDFTYGVGVYLAYWLMGLIGGVAVAILVSIKVWRSR
jgi:hypothetical protein